MKNIAKTKSTWKRLGRSNIVWLLGLLFVLFLMIITWKASFVAILLLGLIALISRNDAAISRETYIKFGLIFYVIAFIVIPISHSNDGLKQESTVGNANSPTNNMSGITPSPTATSVTQPNTMTGNNDGQSTASSTSQNVPSEKSATTASSESKATQPSSKEQTSTTHKQSHNTAHSTHNNEISKHSN